MRRHALLTLALALLVAACGGSERPTVSSEAADALAARAEAIAEHVDAGDGCAATDELGALRGDIDTLSDDELPAALAEELLAAVSDLGDQLSCDPEPDDDGGDEGQGQGPSDDGDDDGDGRGPPDDRGGGEKEKEEKEREKDDDDGDDDEDDD